METVPGAVYGVELRHRPAGEGGLVLELGLQADPASHVGLQLWDGGRTRGLVGGAAVTATWTLVRARSAGGDEVPVRFEGSTIVVDDRTARYPIRIETMLSRCPMSWCSDGDDSTVDICGEAGATCTRMLDDAYRGEPCVWGLFCCLDGVYRDACATETDDASKTARSGTRS